MLEDIDVLVRRSRGLPGVKPGGGHQRDRLLAGRRPHDQQRRTPAPGHAG